MVAESIKAFIESVFSIYNSIGDYIFEFYALHSRDILDILHISLKTIFNVLLFLTVIIATSYLIMSVAVLFRKKKEQRLKSSFEPKVTVQIPTFNELAALHCAKRCLAFDYPKDKLQIIIGDDSDDPEVSKHIDSFAAEHDNVQVTRRGNNIGFKPGNLNHMLKYSDGEILVIFDSDFLPDRDFLRRIVTPFEDPEVSVAQSRWKIANFDQNFISVLGGTILMICHNVALEFIHLFKGTGVLCGSGEAIRKKDLIEVGGWLAGSLTEDIECSLRLIKKGKKLVYLNDLECHCETPHRFKDLCKQQMRWAYGVCLSTKKHIFDILRSDKTLRRDKLSVFIFASGYMFSFLLLGLTVTGFLSIISNRPAAIDWPRFFSETGVNILITSGFLVSCMVALSKNRKIRRIPQVIASSFSVGIAVTYYVNVGIFKALFARQMQWFMVDKNGNEYSG